MIFSDLVHDRNPQNHSIRNSGGIKPSDEKEPLVCFVLKGYFKGVDPKPRYVRTEHGTTMTQIRVMLTFYAELALHVKPSCIN